MKAGCQALHLWRLQGLLREQARSHRNLSDQQAHIPPITGPCIRQPAPA
jgi:hypothetical protein